MSPSSSGGEGCFLVGWKALYLDKPAADNSEPLCPPSSNAEQASVRTIKSLEADLSANSLGGVSCQPSGGEIAQLTS